MKCKTTHNKKTCAMTQMNNRFNGKVQSLLSKGRKNKCIYPGCKKYSVKSHTISKKSSLFKVAEDGKLKTLKSRRNDTGAIKEIQFDLVGIHEATTFKGFCTDHEAIFTDIDTKGISTLRDVFCQIYRTASKEFFISNVVKEAEYDTFGYEFIYQSKSENSKSINSEKVLHLFHDLLIDFPEADCSIPYNENSIFSFKPFSDSFTLETIVVIKKLRFQCPIALQTKITLSRKSNFYDCYILVIPHDNSTTIISISHPDDLQYLLTQVETDIDSLCFIESSMMFDSDCYISPSIISSWKDEKIKAIEDDYRFFLERKFGENYDISIFDQLRIKICNDLNQERCDLELRKINELPRRKIFNERELLLNNKIITDTMLKRKH